MADDNFIYSRLEAKSAHDSSVQDSSDIFARLGQLCLIDDRISIDRMLNLISINCLDGISSKEVNTFVKCQHPKFILKLISDKENVPLLLASQKVHAIYEASVYINGDMVCSEKHELQKEAERRVCLRVLKEKYTEQFEELDILNTTLPLEEEVNISSDANIQRNVALVKSSEESFGITIRGGERKVIRNKEYIQQNIITPIFINRIEKDSPAEKCGLKMGDVLLAINDHSLVNSSHDQAVISLKKFLKRDEVQFTVIHDKKELLKYKAEMRFLDREKENISNEISSSRMGKWHEAKARMKPEEYYMKKFERKNKPFMHKKARKSIRLWDQYK